MRRKILMLMLWGFPLCFCGGTEFPDYSFAPSGNERFVVEGYGSELVGSAERPVPNEPGFWEKLFHGVTGWWSEGSEDWDRMLHDPEWPSYVDPEYWDYFLERYPAYKDEVEDYFEHNPTAPNNPFRLSLIDDIGAIMGMILMGIAYGVFAYRVRRQ